MLLRKKGMVDMQNMIAQFCMSQLGIGPVGEIRMLTGTTGNSRNYFRSRFNDANLHTNIAKAEDAMVTYRNDVLLVTPDNHTWYGDDYVQGAALTWDKSHAHVLGLSPASKAGYHRTRFNHADKATANFMTVSGAGNKFQNLRWMHGDSEGGAADVICLTITGAGNVFEACNFAGPCDATQAASNNYLGMSVSGTQNHFKNCLFGTQNAIDRNGTSAMLYLSGAGGLNVFEDCLFRSHSTANAFFINWASTETPGVVAIFLNCQFINEIASAETDMTYAITSSAHANNTLFFDNRCTFSGVSDIIATGDSAKIKFGGAGANPDTGTIADRKQLGIAQIPVVG